MGKQFRPMKEPSPLIPGESYQDRWWRLAKPRQKKLARMSHSVLVAAMMDNHWNGKNDRAAVEKCSNIALADLLFVKKWGLKGQKKKGE